MNLVRRTVTTAGLLLLWGSVCAPALNGQAPGAGVEAGRDGATAAKGARDGVHKVRIDFNRWHDVAELQADMKALEKAYPKFLKYISLGKSHGGRDIAAMIVNNPETGADASKPAMYIEANIHGNEIQGGEVCLYTIWYLMENYGRVDRITSLVDERAFYIVPTVNPDGRDFFMHGTGAAARTGHFPVDDDGDGMADEDGPADLNGNGVVEQIRKHVPGQGNMKKSGADPRILEPVRPGEAGDYVLLGQEGLDRDGDGRVGEDGPGRYDPNRNYPADWPPNYVR
ncbi:MAG: hypothetical protein EHM13_03765, partial [Acidobacteria bacterium]